MLVKTKRTGACLLVGLLCLIGCRHERPELVVATYTYSTNDRVGNLEPFSKQLSQTLGVSVHTKSYPDVAAMISGVRSGEVDVAFINTLGYLLLQLDNTTMTPVSALNVKDDASDNYKTVMIANKTSGINDEKSLLEKSEGLRISFVSEGSTSGNLVPRLYLSSLGVHNPETRFLQVSYGGDHTRTFEDVVSGNTDIGVLGSNEYFKQISKDPSLKDRIVLLWRSEEIPLGPVLVKNDLSVFDHNRIKQILFNLHIENPEVLESIKAGWSEAKQSERFIAISNSYYDRFRNFNGRSANLPAILKRIGSR